MATIKVFQMDIMSVSRRISGFFIISFDLDYQLNTSDDIYPVKSECSHSIEFVFLWHVPLDAVHVSFVFFRWTVRKASIKWNAPTLSHIGNDSCVGALVRMIMWRKLQSKQKQKQSKLVPAAPAFCIEMSMHDQAKALIFNSVFQRQARRLRNECALWTINTGSRWNRISIESSI